MGEQLGDIEVPKISSKEIVEVVKSIPQERISERMCEQSEVIDVTTISSHKFAARGGADDRCDQNLRPGLAAYSEAVSR